MTFNTFELVFKQIAMKLDSNPSVKTFNAVLLEDVSWKKIEPDLVKESRFSNSNEEYTRKLIYESQNLSAYLLCWLPGQQTDIHGHCGCLCATYIVQGELTNRVFSLSNGSPSRLLKLEEVLLSTGEITFLDRDGIHQSLNTTSKSVISLHLYSPRLSGIQRFPD